MKVVKDNKETAKKAAEVTKGLQSGDKKLALKAVKKARKDGTAEHISMMIELMVNNNDDELNGEIIKLLNDLKMQEAAEPIIEALKEEANKDVHIFLWQALWQSRLDASPYLSDLVNLALKSDYLILLECLTIIENLQNAPEDEVVVQLNTTLKDAVLENHEHRELILSMIEVLNDLMLDK
ncbi:hypothetical protein KFE98_00075 [bacterium SCSIO 12741]|nr:hypothetical protein KFE98_00075 [bacterium SCSIO 12741]